MKTYFAPVMEVVEVMDIITTSDSGRRPEETDEDEL